MNRFNLRNKPRISYYEPEEPSLDEYVFCSRCGDFVYEYCSIHGPLLVIPDDKPSSKSPFPPCVPRAALTIPHVFLHIAPSKIPGAGLGVFTTLALPCGVRFGPYEGNKTEEITSMYCWQINDYNNKRSHVIDAADPNKSNWMRYVNCSRHWYEQNLIAYQYKGRLYYRTIKIIPRYTELMVFYGTEFAHMLHINLKKYNAPTNYAQKFGAPLARNSSLGSENKDISCSTNSIKEKSTESSQKPENNSKSANIQNNDGGNNVTEKKIEKYLSPVHKKAKFNAPKKTQKDKNKITQITNTNNITSRNNNNFKDIKLRTKETKSINSCDFNNNEKVKIECFEQLSKKCDKKIEKTSTNEYKSTHENLLEKKDFNKKTTKEKADNYLPTSRLVQNIFSCDICNFKTSLEKTLTVHLLAHGAKTKYTCPYCNYITKIKNSLNTHIRTHTGEKPYSCNYCEKKFVDKRNLIIHIRTHTGEKPYSCNYCEKKFYRKSHLTIHIRTHTGEKPYSCNYCEKKFNQKGYLNIHIRTHTGEKPYSCNYCEKKFVDKRNLIIHIRTHTGEKPYSCNYCEKKFNHKVSLICHIKTHNTE